MGFRQQQKQLIIDNTTLPLIFASYNSNSLWVGRTEDINQLMNKCDILLQQEHWQLKNQLDNLSSIFTGTHSHRVSGMNEHEIVQGRPYGGVAFLWKESINCKIRPGKCNSNRLCAILVEQVDLLIFNVYISTDTEYDLKNNDIFNNILQSIACVSEETNVDHVVIGGDFNSDLSRFK